MEYEKTGIAGDDMGSMTTRGEFMKFVVFCVCARCNTDVGVPPIPPRALGTQRTPGCHPRRYIFERSASFEHYVCDFMFLANGEDHAQLHGG